MLHGQARSFEDAYKLTKKNFLDKYNVDVFCHLVWDDDIKKNGYTGRRGKFPVNENTPELIVELYKPKKIIVTNDFYFGDENDNLYRDLPRFKNLKCEETFFSLCQLKGISEVSNLFDWSEYDFIIKMRYDCGFENFPNLYELDSDKIYAARDEWGTLDERPDCMIDLSYIVSSNFKHFVDIFNNLKIDTNIMQLFPVESIYSYYLHKHNLSKNLVKLNLNEYKLKGFS